MQQDRDTDQLLFIVIFIIKQIQKKTKFPRGGGEEIN